jgi:hypothetical protein
MHADNLDHIHKNTNALIHAHKYVCIYTAVKGSFKIIDLNHVSWKLRGEIKRLSAAQSKRHVSSVSEYIHIKRHVSSVSEYIHIKRYVSAQSKT